MLVIFRWNATFIEYSSTYSKKLDDYGNYKLIYITGPIQTKNNL